MRETLKVVPFTALAEINPNTQLPLQGECSFLGMSDVTDDGKFVSSHVRSVRESDGYTRFRDEDVLFAKITPCMENGKGSRVDGLVSGYGFGSTEFHVLRAKGDSDSRFVGYWAQSRLLRQRAEAFMVGSAGQRRVSASFFSRFKVPLLAVGEQRRIAETLDALDVVIDSAGQVIDKRSRVKQGVVDGLFSERQDWLGRSLRSFLDHSPKNGFSPSEVGDWTGVRVLGLSCLTPDGFLPKQLKNVPAWCSGVSSAVLEDGDLLISRANTRDLVGLAGRYRDVGGPCLYPDLMMRLRPSGRILSEFLEISLRHSYMRRQIMANAVGTSESMVKISSAIVQNLDICVPSLEEQRRIVSIVDAHDERIAAERARLEKLRKLKAGLMDDLLTGRVRVNQLQDLPV
ncbi:restriction endonuclease subunit S [Nocardiopsis synnemataformans]|uniref:restriction endonuclease subunit S n=1 Tax=Nocardiopsis synnemataformans TaxID=61305 RepID=UPI003EB6C951